MAFSYQEIHEGQSAAGSGQYYTHITRRYSVWNMTADEDPGGVLFPHGVSPAGAIDRLTLTACKKWTAYDTAGYLRSVHYEAEATGPHSAEVTVHYVNTRPKYYRGGTGLELSETDRTQPGTGGDQIIVHTPDGTPQTGLINIFTPGACITITRVEAAEGSGAETWTDPVELADFYVGNVNSAQFLRFPKWTLMCENIGYDDDGMAGIAWNMTYELRYRPNGWEEVATALDKDLRPYKDSLYIAAKKQVWGYGRKIVPYYYERDFNALNLA